MKKVVLIHQDNIQHYRVAIYNYLSKYLYKKGYDLYVVSEGIQDENCYIPTFAYNKMPLNIISLMRYTIAMKPLVVILFVNLKHYYLFPFILFLKIINIKVVYWGHGIDLQDQGSLLKLLIYKLQHIISDALILYADHLKKNIDPALHKKCFIANNTLNLEDVIVPSFEKKGLLLSYGIKTLKNIVFTGRVQRRKRIEDLLSAFKLIKDCQTGLVIIGPMDKDLETVLHNKIENVFFLGPLYGERVLQLLMACDVYCIPGAIGLSIVDAQFCGLPVVTEDVDHGPEIMYLKNGQNGYIVPKGDIAALAEKIRLLLEDDKLSQTFSENAYRENKTNGHIDRLCEGFNSCLDYFYPYNDKILRK